MQILSTFRTFSADLPCALFRCRNSTLAITSCELQLQLQLRLQLQLQPQLQLHVQLQRQTQLHCYSYSSIDYCYYCHGVLAAVQQQEGHLGGALLRVFLQ